MEIKGIAFDLEGPVINVEFAHHQGHLKTAAEVGVNLTLEEALDTIAHFIGGPDEAIAHDIFNLSGNQTSPEAILERIKFHYNQILKDINQIQLRPGFLEFLEEVRGTGLKTSIGSLTVRNQALVLLRVSGLDQLFPSNHILLREDVTNVKPDPEIYLRTAQIMRVDPKQQLVFDDSPNGVRAAIAAGSRAIGMPVYNRPSIIEGLHDAGAEQVFLNWRNVNLDILFAS